MQKLELHWPIATPCAVTQPFGVNGAYYRANGINIEGHNGLDLLAGHRQPVYASHDGYAHYEIDDKQGHGVVIRSKEPAIMFGQLSHYKTIYWHLCDPKTDLKYPSPIRMDGREVEVKMGDLLGYADSTGLSTGDHLHYALKPIAKDTKGRWINARQDNGYGGCIDPAFYMSTFSAVDFVKIEDGVEQAAHMIDEVQKLSPEARAEPARGIAAFLSTLLRKLLG